MAFRHLPGSPDMEHFQSAIRGDMKLMSTSEVRKIIIRECRSRMSFERSVENTTLRSMNDMCGIDPYSRWKSKEAYGRAVGPHPIHWPMTQAVGLG